MRVELKVPKVGESITEVQVGDWLKAEGEPVQRDEAVVMIETDKATVEVSAPSAGRVSKVLKKKGQTATVGEVIGWLEEVGAGDGSGAAGTKAPAAGKPAEGASPPAPAPSASSAPPAAAPARPGDSARVMPAARRALAEHGVRAEDVEPSGPRGHILKQDVLRTVARKEGQGGAGAVSPLAGAPEPADALPAPPVAPGARDEEVVPMTLLRRRVAARLKEAQNAAALLTTFNEIDLSAVIALRKQHQEAFQKRHGVKLGFMSFFVKAAIESLQQTPELNAEIRDDAIVYRNYYDIGIAVGGGRGLVVPILRNAERMSFAQVELAIADFGARAQKNALKLEELQGGTFTLSNGGVYGSLLSTPIVNPPQSGILGLHAIQERPVAREGQVVIRPMMYVALTYDHRIVDGREAVTFLKRIKETVEEPARLLLEV